MTSNLAEVYNWVIRGLRGCPLVGIIEGMLYGIIKYYQKCHAAAVLHSTKVQTPYCNKMYIWMEKAVAKASQQIVIAMGTHDNHFEITISIKGGVGRETTLATHQVNLGQQFNGQAECTCNKLMLLHVPCSHVLASLAQVGVSSGGCISTFYLKENVEQTWSGNFYGFMACGDFSVYNKDLPICLPPMDLLRHSHDRVGCPQTRRIHNDMDESEAGGPMRRCRTCEQFNHKTIDCPSSSSDPVDLQGGSTSENPRGRGRSGRHLMLEDYDYAV